MGEGTRYAALTERAYNYLIEHGGVAEAGTLAGMLLGGGVKPGFWNTLLPLILQDDRFVQLPDGRWALAGWEAHTPFAQSDLQDRPYLVVDVETTGLSPYRERVIEIAVLRLERGQVAARYCALVNPQRHIGSFITRYTGITNDMVQGEPSFADILPELTAFIRSAGATPIFVGHNTLFDAGFLRAEFERAGEPWLAALLLDTMRLGIRLIPGLRKPSLDRLATALNIPVMNRHRAEGDAKLTAHAFNLLLQRACSAGIATLDQLGEIGAVGQNRTDRPSTAGVPRARLIARPAPPDLPERPGIYMMKDAQGQVIYVGKARNLRRRVNSYYTQPLGYTRRMDGLMESLHTVEIHITGSELEALLLESRMIRRYKPRYNVQGRNWQDYLFIKLTVPKTRKTKSVTQIPEPVWPRVSATRKGEGSYTFGPFRNSQAVRVTIEVLGMLFPVHVKQYRRMTASFVMHDQALSGDPQATLQAVRRFLEGDSDSLLTRLHDERNRAADQRQYERARHLRQTIEQVERILQGQRLISETLSTGPLAIVQPSAEEGCAEIIVTLGGLPLGQLRVTREQDAAGVIQMLVPFVENSRIEQLTAVEQEQLDELHILARWLHANRETGPVVALPLSTQASGEWDVTAQRVLELVAQQSQLQTQVGDDDEEITGDEEEE